MAECCLRKAGAGMGAIASVELRRVCVNQLGKSINDGLVLYCVYIPFFFFFFFQRG